MSDSDTEDEDELARARAAKFGQRLREARELRGLTQRELAQRCWGEDADGGQVSNLENGHRLPSMLNLLRIVSVLRVGADHLLGLTSDDELRDDIDRLSERDRGLVLKLAREMAQR